jgi:hypothetical protein
VLIHGHARRNCNSSWSGGASCANLSEGPAGSASASHGKIICARASIYLYRKILATRKRIYPRGFCQFGNILETLSISPADTWSHIDVHRYRARANPVRTLTTLVTTSTNQPEFLCAFFSNVIHCCILHRHHCQLLSFRVV